MNNTNLLKARIAQSTTGRYHSFVASMIEVGVPHAIKFFNGLLIRVDLRDDELLRIMNRYGKISFPASGAISSLYRVHPAIELGVLVDIALTEASSRNANKEQLYRQCLPRTAQNLLHFNGIEHEILEGVFASRY